MKKIVFLISVLFFTVTAFSQKVTVKLKNETEYGVYVLDGPFQGEALRSGQISDKSVTLEPKRYNYTIKYYDGNNWLTKEVSSKITIFHDYMRVDFSSTASTQTEQGNFVSSYELRNNEFWFHNQTGYEITIETGPYRGLVVKDKDSAVVKFNIDNNLLSFNIKASGGESPFPLLEIIKRRISKGDEKIIIKKEDFRSRQKKEEEKIRMINSLSQKVFILLGDKKIALEKKGQRNSRKLKIAGGWYYAELSYLEDRQVKEDDIPFLVAEGEKELIIRKKGNEIVIE